VSCLTSATAEAVDRATALLGAGSVVATAQCYCACCFHSLVAKRRLSSSSSSSSNTPCWSRRSWRCGRWCCRFTVNVQSVLYCCYGRGSVASAAPLSLAAAAAAAAAAVAEAHNLCWWLQLHHLSLDQQANCCAAAAPVDVCKQGLVLRGTSPPQLALVPASLALAAFPTAAAAASHFSPLAACSRSVSVPAAAWLGAGEVILLLPAAVAPAASACCSWPVNLSLMAAMARRRSHCRTSDPCWAKPGRLLLVPAAPQADGTGTVELAPGALVEAIGPMAAVCTTCCLLLLLLGGLDW